MIPKHFHSHPNHKQWNSINKQCPYVLIEIYSHGFCSQNSKCKNSDFIFVKFRKKIWTPGMSFCLLTTTLSLINQHVFNIVTYHYCPATVLLPVSLELLWKVLLYKLKGFLAKNVLFTGRRLYHGQLISHIHIILYQQRNSWLKAVVVFTVVIFGFSDLVKNLVRS